MGIEVKFSRRATKDLRKVPSKVATKLSLWVLSLETVGLMETRKEGGKGLHDEPLKGKRSHQRSIRLSKNYRAIYEHHKDKIEFVMIEEVNKHEY